MTRHLQLRLLGDVSLQLDGEPVSGLPSRAAEALLIYLACHDRPLPRERLAELLWADRAPKQALANLRTILTSLRREVGEFLSVNRQTLAFNHRAGAWLDLAEFEGRISRLITQDAGTEALTEDAARDLREVLDLYRGDFLEGFYLPEGLGFEEWSLVTRERLRRTAADGLRRLAAYDLSTGDYLAGMAAASRLLAIDAYDEAAQRTMMWLLVRNGQPNAAIKQYQDLHKLLSLELGVEPASETRALYEQIRVLRFPPPNKLPKLATKCIGREGEIRAVMKRLASPEARLVTIFGPGGIGKTRLALEVGRRIAETRPGQFLNGIYFVPLTGVHSPQFLLTGIAEALGLELQSSELPLTQLTAHLQDKELLLILDNFEQLLPITGDKDGGQGGDAQLVAILDLLQGVKLLVTSRERLNLYEELVYEVPGLKIPEVGVTAPEEYSAVQLFCETARQNFAPFYPTSDEMAAVVRICQILEGVPLAIELASDWVRLFTCNQIQAEIERSLDILSTSVRNIPDRHRSLRAVFNHSWGLLSSEEQSVYSKLSTFRGGFTFEAAAAVAQTDRDTLLSLADKSLMRQAAEERFEIHELLRQYAEEELDANLDVRRQVHQAHCDYYTVYLARLDPDQAKPAPAVILGSTARELSNIRLAWAWALDKPDLPGITRGLRGLAAYYLLKGPLHEGESVLESTIGRLRSPDLDESEVGPLLSMSLAYQARFLIWQGKYDGVLALAAEAIQLARDCGDAEAEVLAKLSWGEADWHQGAYDTAESHYQDALGLSTEAGLHYLEAESLRFLGRAYWPQGDYAQANHFYNQALARYRQMGDIHGETMTLNDLGVIAFEQDNYSQARSFMHQAAQVNREVGNLLSEGKILTNLCVMCCFQGDFVEAADHNERALRILDELGERAGYAANLRNRGMIDVYLGDFESAQAAQNRALSLFESIGDRRGQGYALAGLSNLYHQWGKNDLSRDRGQQALAIARELDINFSAAKALTFLGNALVELGQQSEAAEAYEEACSLANESNQPVLAMEAVGGLARIALAQNNQDLARDRITFVLDQLDQRTPEGAAEPFRIYLTCYRILEACGDPGGLKILTTGNNLLQKQAKKIKNQTTRRSFLQNVPANRDLTRAYKALSG